MPRFYPPPVPANSASSSRSYSSSAGSSTLRLRPWLKVGIFFFFSLFYLHYIYIYIYIRSILLTLTAARPHRHLHDQPEHVLNISPPPPHVYIISLKKPQFLPLLLHSPCIEPPAHRRRSPWSFSRYIYYYSSCPTLKHGMIKIKKKIVFSRMYGNSIAYYCGKDQGRAALVASFHFRKTRNNSNNM